MSLEVAAVGDEVVQVGKYTLESLTTGMYSDPKIVYREYIQNSVDSLEHAVSLGILEQQSMRIDIIVNADKSYISVKDNGTGISATEAAQTLMNVGSSKKRNANNRGFRGIGRLGGMSYCDTLIFTTSAENEKVKTVVSFDCKKLRHLLVPGKYEDMSLSAILEEITTIETFPEREEKHYLCVEMADVNSFSDLLDIDVAKSYISQVAPLPYQSRHFIYTSQLKSYLSDNGYIIEEFPIFVGENESDLEPVYKPNKSSFRSDRGKRTVDEISSMKYFNVTIDGELYALGWYGNCGWFGFLSEKVISGFRVRKGNILIGDNQTMNTIFKEARFNGWTQGEIFIVTDKLIPNARRDDFEQNEAYYKFMEALSNSVGMEITRTIREASLTRNNPNAKALREIERKIGEASTAVAEGFNSTVDKEKMVATLTESATSLAELRVGNELTPKKKELQEKIEVAIEEVSESKNFKINQINSGIDKKSKHVLKVVSDILSRKLAKVLVDEIIEDIVTELNRK